MIIIENAPLVAATVPSDGNSSSSSVDEGIVFAVTSNAHVQRANAAYVSSPLSLRRSVARERKVVAVLQNETASVEFRADSCVLASDDATTCVIAVVVCQATGVASVCHFDEETSASEACFRKFMSQHVGGRYCTYDAYLVGGMVEETLVGLRTATNLLTRMQRSPGTFNLRLCCVYDQNTCGQTGCPLVRSLAVDPLTSTAYHVSTSSFNLGLASIHRNLSQHNLEALVAHHQQQQQQAEEGKASAAAAAEGGSDKSQPAAAKHECPTMPMPAPPAPMPPALSCKGKKRAIGFPGAPKRMPPKPKQHRGPGLERRLAHYWVSGFASDGVADLVNVYDTWEQKYVLPGRLHTIPRWLMVDYAYLLTLSDDLLLKRTSTTPQYEGESFCADVRLALGFILRHHEDQPNFTLYEQSYTWDYANSVWMEVDKFGDKLAGKKMKGMVPAMGPVGGIGGGLTGIPGIPGMGGMGGPSPHSPLHSSDLPRVDIPGSSWSYNSLVDLEKEALRG